MSFNREGEGFDRKMYKGNWKCDECGAEITELPFEPSEGRSLYCKECWREKRNQRRK